MHEQQAFIDPVLIAFVLFAIVVVVVMLLNRNLSNKEMELLELKEENRILKKQNQALQNNYQTLRFMKTNKEKPNGKQKAKIEKN